MEQQAQSPIEQPDQLSPAELEAAQEREWQDYLGWEPIHEADANADQAETDSKQIKVEPEIEVMPLVKHGRTKTFERTHRSPRMKTRTPAQKKEQKAKRARHDVLADLQSRDYGLLITPEEMTEVELSTFDLAVDADLEKLDANQYTNEDEKWEAELDQEYAQTQRVESVEKLLPVIEIARKIPEIIVVETIKQPEKKVEKVVEPQRVPAPKKPQRLQHIDTAELKDLAPIDYAIILFPMLLLLIICF